MKFDKTITKKVLSFNPLNQVYRLNEAAKLYDMLKDKYRFNPLNQVYRLNLRA